MTPETDPHRALQENLDFLLHEMFGLGDLLVQDRYAEHGAETADLVMQTAAAIARDHFKPHNRASDLRPPELVDGAVKIIPAVGAALRELADAGFIASTFEPEHGGLRMPVSVYQASMCHFYMANVATASFAFLTVGAANLVAAFASDDLREIYLRPMLEGRFFGTMALTEPQAGSSLADVRTSAQHHDDGTWHLTGEKIFISGGDHQLSENIVHMVLARTSADGGTKGLSLFLVPKFLPDADGAFTKRNGVGLAGLIHKMGWRGITSTHLKFGEVEPCVGYILGAPGQGMAQMFQMMNEARIAVGLCATMLAYSGYRDSLRYGHERAQGRALRPDADRSRPALLVEHADIKRMILRQKSISEGALALCLMAACLVDTEKSAQDDAERAAATRRLALLTPIVKTWPSEHGLAANAEAIQVHGGYGYTQDFNVEQYYRDNRLNPIHEGTTGIQAADFLLRKIGDDPAEIERLMAEIRADAGDVRSISGLSACADALEEACGYLDEMLAFSGRLAKQGRRAWMVENAVVVLNAAGTCIVGWLWLRQARAALASDRVSRDFADGKSAACAYFCQYELRSVEAAARAVLRDSPFFSELDVRCL